MKTLSNRIDRAFDALRRQKRKALIAYLTGGFPTLAATDRAAKTLAAAGVDLLEIGVPFSDPIADGPTLQYSAHKALENGATLARLLEWAGRFRRRSSIPLVFMTYMNPVHRFGVARFAAAARRAGVDGVIVPDLPLEEAAVLEKPLAAAGLALIHLVAPTTPPARRARIAARTRGFLYAVSLTGVTGARSTLPRDLEAFVRDVKRRSPAPVAVGFGISTPAAAARVARVADGVIVGSALVQRLRDRRPLLPFVRSLRRALDGAPSSFRRGGPHGR